MNDYMFKFALSIQCIRATEIKYTLSISSVPYCPIKHFGINTVRINCFHQFTFTVQCKSYKKKNIQDENRFYVQGNDGPRFVHLFEFKKKINKIQQL